MNNIDIAKTASKVFGLYFIILTTINIRDVIFYTTGTFILHEGLQGAIVILESHIYQAIFNSLVALVLIFKSDWVADKLSLQKTKELNTNLNKTDWIELSLITISALAILYSFPLILYKLVNYIYFNDYDEGEKHLFWTNRNKADIYYSIFQFAVGLFFLLNARNFARRLIRTSEKDDKS